MAAPTLLFCAGATKAGTSWLHRYLSDHPQCHMRGIKELHYFDSVEADDYETWITDVRGREAHNRAMLDKVKPELRGSKQRVADDAAAWAGVLEQRRPDDAAYLGYLKGGIGDQHRLVADFTPAYGLLSQKMLAHMAALQPDVRFVYLLRDPVDRIWSHARMIAKRRANKPSEVPHRSINILKRVIKGKEPEIVRRSDYIGTLERLRNTVQPDKLKVVFYEDLFSNAAIGALCDFLGLDLTPADFETRVLKGPKAVMEDGQPREMREFLAAQYDYIAENFDRVPARWNLKVKV